jgi:outer membrane receptor protein involved in Fe transport
VLKDGASAVYGSDAVAGVVNIILRDDFEGIEVTGGYGGASGYDETRLSAIAGFGDDNANVTIIADYFENDSLENTERGYLARPTSPRGAWTCISTFPAAVVDNVSRAACHRSPRRQIVLDYGPYNPDSRRSASVYCCSAGFGDGSGSPRSPINTPGAGRIGRSTAIAPDRANHQQSFATVSVGIRHRTVDAGHGGTSDRQPARRARPAREWNDWNYGAQTPE